MIANKVKLVIWDLDDTFWRGTLSEEGVETIAGNVEIVLELSKRGIVNSICSKNDAESAKMKLSELGIYEYFVFPTISFDPKGQAVSRIIEDAALRAENVLFIDDNQLNLEEVKFFNPGIMACHPSDVLEGLLGHPHLVGKPDPELTRLKQYQFLQQKVEKRSTTTLSNEEFLRASHIKISIDIDVEGNFERVIDLINRSNQLNYTKVRLNTSGEIASFRESLTGYGYQAGCIRVVDDYGDYGLIGFYLMQRRADVKRLVHFVFSCRAMHMGIEQYVYEMLGRPDIAVVNPVSYGLDTHSKVDWIQTQNISEGGGADVSDRKLLLLGGCDLLQLASFCSSNRVEFVNKMQEGMKVRYDDPGFIMSDRAAIRGCESIRKIPLWTYEDALLFDESVSSSDIILISLWPAAQGKYFRTRQGVLIHFSKQLTTVLKERYPDWLKNDVEKLHFNLKGRLELVRSALRLLSTKVSSTSKVFLFGCYTLGALKEEARRDRVAYNHACRNFCSRTDGLFEYIDVDAIVPQACLLDKGHFAREGYFMIAQHILARVAGCRPNHLALDAA